MDIDLLARILFSKERLTIHNASIFTRSNQIALATTSKPHNYHQRCNVLKWINPLVCQMGNMHLTNAIASYWTLCNCFVLSWCMVKQTNVRTMKLILTSKTLTKKDRPLFTIFSQITYWKICMYGFKVDQNIESHIRHHYWSWMQALFVCLFSLNLFDSSSIGHWHFVVVVQFVRVFGILHWYTSIRWTVPWDLLKIVIIECSIVKYYSKWFSE